MKVNPKKSLGQNFLSNPKILDKIVEAAEITKDDVILEIGPGTGNLTVKLAEKAGRVLAIEKDHRLIEELKTIMPANVEVIEDDILKFDPTKYDIPDTKYKIVGNIPYYLTSHLLRIIFESWPRPKTIVLTIQKEVAKRIVAKPPKMSILSISIQFYSEPKVVGYITKNNFHPKPKVDSAIIKFIPKDNLPIADTSIFFDVVRLGFSSKRKKLINNLSKKIDRKILQSTFLDLGLRDTARAEELSLGNWLALAEKFNI